MASTIFPEPAATPVLRVAPIEIIVRVSPLSAIHELLSISIHDLVNDPDCKRIVADLYRITRRIEDEAWLRRQL